MCCEGTVERHVECVVGNENFRQDVLFQIRWFRENTTGTVETLGDSGDPIFRQSVTDLTSRYQDTKFLNQPYSPSLLEVLVSGDQHNC